MRPFSIRTAEAIKLSSIVSISPLINSNALHLEQAAATARVAEPTRRAVSPGLALAGTGVAVAGTGVDVGAKLAVTLVIGVGTGVGEVSEPEQAASANIATIRAMKSLVCFLVSFNGELLKWLLGGFSYQQQLHGYFVLNRHHDPGGRHRHLELDPGEYGASQQVQHFSVIPDFQVEGQRDINAVDLRAAGDLAQKRVPAKELLFSHNGAHNRRFDTLDTIRTNLEES